MATITSISVQEKNKKRCNLFLDNEFFAGVSLETALKFRLKVGIEVDQKDLAEILFDSEKIEGLEKAISFTSKSLKTKKQVVDYLYRKGYSSDIVNHCVDKLIEYKLIDDGAFARRYIETTSKNQGRHLAEFKLMQKGVRKDDINSAFSETYVDSKENARAMAIKHFKNKEKTKENIAKTYRYLIGRGFTYEEASYAVEVFNKEDC